MERRKYAELVGNIGPDLVRLIRSVEYMPTLISNSTLCLKQLSQVGGTGMVLRLEEMITFGSIRSGGVRRCLGF